MVRYKESVIEHAEDTMLGTGRPRIVQWVADNVDHNIITLTGKETFHGMGLISIHSSGFIRSIFWFHLKVSSIVQNKGINMLQFIGSSQSGLSKLKFDPILNLQYPTVITSEMYCDLVWHTGWFLIFT